MRERSQPFRDKRGLRAGAVILLALLLALPALALLRLSQMFDGRYVLGYAALVSAAALWAYRHDKRCAQAGERRTPESTLHFVEFIGGWPGAFLAQRLFRHKIVKTSYQAQFWVIVALHEFASLDFLQDWRWSGNAFASLSLYLARLR